MAGWDETTLRGAASWKAFKEGKALLDAGAVSGAKRGTDSWTGSVREGKRTYRVAVKVISPTHFEARCGCPENQATGALCAHSVAAGLAVLKGPSGPALVAKAEPAPVEKRAYAISFPVNWREALKRGRISATISEAKERADADDRIGAWLAQGGKLPALPVPVNPDPVKTAEFLRAVAGHPRVAVGKTGEAVTVSGDGGRVRVETLERKGERVVLRAAAVDLVRLGVEWWVISEGEVSRLGTGAADAVLAGVLEKLASAGVAEIALKDLLREVARWQEWLELPEGSWLDGIHFVPAPAEFVLAVDGSLQRLEATLRVRYPGSPPVIPGLGQVAGLPVLREDRCEIRDFDAERDAVGKLEKLGFRGSEKGDGRWTLSGEEGVVAFLSKKDQSFQANWEIIEGDSFRKVGRQVAFVKPRIDILGSGEDWLSFNLSFQANDGSMVPMSEIRRLLGSGKSGSGKKVVLSEEVSNLVEPLLGDLDLKQEGGHFVASKRAGEVIREIRKKLDKTFIKKDEDSYSQIPVGHLVRAELRSYQQTGIRWLVDRGLKFGGGLLADDMGLGKTVQTIASIEYLIKEKPPGMVLVVATASLLGNWKAEFGKFAPERRVRILHGSGREREQSQAVVGDVLLTTFGTLPRDLAWYLKQEFLAVVVDEASLMRNPDTDHAKAISRLNARVRFALTGTPIENGVRDLWSIFRFIQPGWLGAREDFKERYEQAAEDGSAMARLRLKVSPFLLRRTKEEVAPDLPSKILIEEFCELSAEQRSVYRDLLVEGRKKVEATKDSGNQGAARMQVLTALLRLRQTCCDLALLGSERFQQLALPKRSGKLERLLELVQEAISGNHRVLVFSQFSTQLREIGKSFDGLGIACLKLDGQTRNRQELVDRFQAPDGPPVFLISLKAGGYGLNLTAADIVIHFDPWWNPAAEAQATDRAHRIGQTRPVTVYRMITRGTVEEKVVGLQNRKRWIAAAVDEEGGGDAAGWSEEELAGMLNADFGMRISE